MGVGSPGLDLLASAALAPEKREGNGSLLKPGPFNPAASLAKKVTKRILDLEYVEMAEVTADTLPESVSGRPHPPSRPPITDISQWIERYSLMAALVAARFPHKAPELFAYQAMIVRAERNYEAGRWVAYDRQFRREALARRDLNWSVPDSRLYSEAFTGRARSIPRCGHCLQDDHLSHQCPQNPSQLWMPWPVGPMAWQKSLSGQGPANTPTTRQASRSGELCRRFNEGRCRFASCKFAHSCRTCGGSHPAIACLQGGQRPRSPIRGPAAPVKGSWSAMRR